MTRLCLDTSAYSQFDRGHKEVLEVIDSAQEIFLPVVVLGELRIGFLLGGKEHANERRLGEFMRRSVVRVLEIDEETTVLYAQISVDLRRAGKKVSPNDLWIAASALREGATVLSFDEHFRLIPRVGCLILKP